MKEKRFKRSWLLIIASLCLGIASAIFIINGEYPTEGFLRYLSLVLYSISLMGYLIYLALYAINKSRKGK